MDPNNSKPPGEKPPQQKRSFGPFLLFTTALLLLLVILGNSSSTRNITDDRFWHALYAGDVASIASINTENNQVTGEFKKGAPFGEETKFSLTVADVQSKVDRIRTLVAQELETLPQNQFLEDVEDGRKVPLRGYAMQVREPLNSPSASGRKDIWKRRFFVDYLDDEGQHYAELVSGGRLEVLKIQAALAEADAPIEDLTYDLVAGLKTEEGYSFFMSFLVSFGPILLFIALFWFIFMRQMRGQGQGLMSFGRSRALLYNKEKKTGITFADVAGIDEAKDEVAEIIEFLRNPAKFQKLGGRIPRGVLLVGNPGTGKTLLAKAIAGEAEVPFLSISGSDFVEMFVGVGASRVRDLFKQAKESAPCIVFLDEIDAVGRKRGSGMGGGHDEREQTLNAILVEMDGFGTDEGIIVVAATNRPDVLDPALLRPGRFDREIVIDLPDLAGREKILKVHTRRMKLAADVKLLDVARGTPGFSGAELAALVNEAAIIAAMRDKDSVAQEDLEEARDKVRFGREKKSRVMDEEDKRITAYHESGHAIVGALLEHAEPVHKVTIIPRGMALGATMYLPEKDHLHLSRRKLLDQLAVAYGGRVAEDLFCDDITAGAANDIQYATQMARMMIMEWGMSERLGPIRYGERVGSDFLGAELSIGKDYSEATVREIDEEISRILNEAHQRARDIITSQREAVERVTEALLLHETISGQELQRLLDGTSPEDLRPAPIQPETGTEAAPEAARKSSRRPDPEPFTPRGDEGLSPA